MTRLELTLIIGAVGVALGATGLLSGSASAGTEREAAEADARRVLLAAQAWQQENASGCPTLTLLQRDGKLADESKTDDAWGSRFRVVCTDQGTQVVSPGRDGKLRTEDDIVAKAGEPRS